MKEIKERLETVENNILSACCRSGRKREEVTLIAVSKTKPVSDILEAYACGCRYFGENRVQELLEKSSAVSRAVSWHLIGHLQKNKVKYLPGVVAMIHSVDSLELAMEIDRQAHRHGLSMNILCEVNAASEETKFGVKPDQTQDLVKSILSECSHLCVCGLMTVAPRTDNPESNRPYFRILRDLMLSINQSLPDDKQLRELSMGMSGDYEVAIEEGATIVRVGTGIFGPREYP